MAGTRRLVQYLGRMNVGLFFAFRNPPRWRRPFPEFYAEQLAQIRLAEELGYDTVWLSEHHFAEDGYSPSLIPIGAAVAATTRRVRIGTFLVILPLHDAIRVAEDAATIDVISNGRLDLGLGQGYAPHEYEGFGIPRRERPTRLEEGVEVIRGLWTRSPFSFEGKHYRVHEARLMPPPVQKPHPPLWIGARGPKGIERAARLGAHFLGLGHPLLQGAYDDALRRLGRDPRETFAAQLHWLYVAPSADQAWADAVEHFHYLLEWYGRWAAAANDFPGDKDLLSGLPPANELRTTKRPLLFQPIFGSPDEVAERLERSMAEVRTTHLVLGMHLPGLAPEKTRRSMELFAQSVLPRIQKNR